MDISLTPELESYIEERVRAGQYVDASDVISNALSALRAQEEASSKEVEKLRREIAIGISQAEQGDFVEFTAEDVIADGRKRLANRSK